MPHEIAARSLSCFLPSGSISRNRGAKRLPWEHPRVPLRGLSQSGVGFRCIGQRFDKRQPVAPRQFQKFAFAHDAFGGFHCTLDNELGQCGALNGRAFWQRAFVSGVTRASRRSTVNRTVTKMFALCRIRGSPGAPYSQHRDIVLLAEILRGAHDFGWVKCRKRLSPLEAQ